MGTKGREKRGEVGEGRCVEGSCAPKLPEELCHNNRGPTASLIRSWHTIFGSKFTISDACFEANMAQYHMSPEA